MIALGFDIASGVAYAAEIETSVNAASIERLDRLTLSNAPSEADVFGGLFSRARQHLRAIRPAAIGIMETSKYNNWAYRSAAERARIEAAILIAAHHEGVEAMMISIHDAARHFDVNRTEVLPLVASRFDLGAITYTDRRAAATAAAVVALAMSSGAAAS